MKPKQFIISLFFFAVSLCMGTASAQSVSFPVTGPDSNLMVQYLVDKGSSVLLLCSYTPDAAKEGAAPYLRNISRRTRISTPDGDYALLNTIHIPVRNEADVKYAYIKNTHPSLNCILEFEKFPYDEPFDLVEDDEESSLFTARGLTVDNTKDAEIDAEGFLAGSPYYEYGYRFEEGAPVHYFDDADIYLASSSWPFNSDGDFYQPVGFQIVNRMDTPLNVKFSDVSASAVRLNKKKKPVKCDISILNEKRANEEWEEIDRIEVMHEVPTNAGQYAANAATRAALDTGVPAFASLGLLALGMVVRAASEPDYEPYMKERNQEREELMKLYLRDTTVQPGDTLSTFVSIKYNGEPVSTNVSISLNGETYIMKY